jgi:CRISPR-associated protein Csb1
MIANAKAFPECVEDWFADDGPAAIVLRELLRAADAFDDEPSTVFPPTYPPPEEKKREEKSGYNISETRTGKLCLIDSVGSQANRLEPLFKDGKYSKLVPQVRIKAGETTLNLLDAGHRAADAIVRCTDLADEIEKAFIAYRKFGNAVPLAKIAPTSLLFGVWDSRGTQVKLPRLLASTIEATDVEVLVQSAQYIPVTEYGDKKEGLLEGIDGADSQKLLSKAGFSHAPSPKTPGGVKVRGEIRRKATLSLAGIRELRGGSDGETSLLRRYILGLGLTALTADQGKTLNLRQGCLLTRVGGTEGALHVVFADGTRQQVSVMHTEAVVFAQKAAGAFGVGLSKEAVFKKERARKEIAKAKKEKTSE